MIRVLIADDQALVRSGLRTILEDEPDLEIVGEAVDGLDAVQLARRRNADLVLMDIHMPRMDGIEATRRLAGPGVEDPVDVLALTTFDLDEYVFGALRAGASGFLLKDAPPEELVRAIRVVAAGQGLIAPQVTRRLISRFAQVSPADERAAALAALSPREDEVLRQMARGRSNAEIARALQLEESTVKSHVSRLLDKLGLTSRVQAVILAYEVGHVTPGEAELPPLGG
ncbi:MAG TPA: response regulator transcription factor [Solirubrobacteraceae bacterium]|nr:response regulator transcription factor [Solirubrobacteraceae bacterium]